MDLFAAVSATIYSGYARATDDRAPHPFVVVPFRSQESSTDEYTCLLVYRTPAVE
jgi:hypothetical protein